MILQFDHANLVVRDLQGMTAFYRDRLGFRVTKEVSISGAWVEKTVGLRNVHADVVYLDPPSGPRLELIYYHSPQADRPVGLERGNTPGIRHLAFLVDDMDATVDSLRAGGVIFQSAIQEVPNSQAQYAGGARKRLVYFYDPEDNLLELCAYEIPTTNAPKG